MNLRQTEMAVKKLAENTYRISEWGAFGPVKMYLLIGNERALLIAEMKKEIAEIKAGEKAINKG